MERNERRESTPDRSQGFAPGCSLSDAAILARGGIRTTRQAARVCFAAIGDVLNKRLSNRDAGSVARDLRLLQSRRGE